MANGLTNGLKAYGLEQAKPQVMLEDVAAKPETKRLPLVSEVVKGVKE